ncbi:MULTISPECIES: hypothetical protein [unclassified Pseudomonas]|uniref:hypothetical protein n=1 Tax=unclassified Pseudomonas TaxID=196821 RepID=UPI001140014E|nr:MULTISPECIES: hypothetical protein [unclassified Pseudomonas]
MNGDELMQLLTNTDKAMDVLQGNLGDALAREAALRTESFVPGQARCAECKFQLSRFTLYLDGTTGPADNNPEPCPNGCGPLWPVTWKQRADEYGALGVRLIKERDGLQRHLNAADQRVDTATSLIRRLLANFDTEIRYHEDVEPNDLEHDQVLNDMRAFIATQQ